jgi:UDPglucose 6-dehydrogenase
VRVYDPVSLPNLAKEQPHLAGYDSIDAVLDGAHAAVVATDWDKITAIEPDTFLDRLAYPIVVDGRNVYDPDTMIEAGLRYHSMGRRSVET